MKLSSSSCGVNRTGQTNIYYYLFICEARLYIVPTMIKFVRWIFRLSQLQWLNFEGTVHLVPLGRESNGHKWRPLIVLPTHWQLSSLDVKIS